MEQSIGKPIDRFDSHDKVTGKALFPGDINLPDQVFMRTLFSPSPHAIIRQIEFADALKVPGVLAVITSKDVPSLLLVKTFFFIIPLLCSYAIMI